jgi:hypothetical protein
VTPRWIGRTPVGASQLHGFVGPKEIATKNASAAVFGCFVLVAGGNDSLMLQSPELSYPAQSAEGTHRIGGRVPPGRRALP